MHTRNTVETSHEKSSYRSRAVLGLAMSTLLLSSCNSNNVSGFPQPKSVIEEASVTGSSIPLPIGMECPAGGQLVIAEDGETPVAQAFIAEQFTQGRSGSYLAANYPEQHYQAKNGMDVYCGDSNWQNGVEIPGKMIVPNSCVDTGESIMGQVGAIVLGIDPHPIQPWFQDAPGTPFQEFVGCPKTI